MSLSPASTDDEEDGFRDGAEELEGGEGLAARWGVGEEEGEETLGATREAGAGEGVGRGAAGARGRGGAAEARAAAAEEEESGVARLLVRVDEEEFVITCALESDVRWLALTAADRYTRAQQAAGRVRAQDRRDTPSLGRPQPECVRRKPLSPGGGGSALVVQTDIVGPTTTIGELVRVLNAQAASEHATRERARAALREENERRHRVKQAALGEAEWFARHRVEGEGVTEAGTRLRWLLPEEEVSRRGLSTPLALRVTLMRTRAQAPNGALARPLWSSLAFSFSDEGRRAAEKLVLEHEAWLVARAAELTAEEDSKHREEMERMEALLDVDPSDEKALERSLDADWTHVRVQNVARDEEDALECKKVILRRFRVLSDVYRHYSGTSVRGAASSMEFQEFQHLCFVTGLANPTKENRLIESAFARANARRTGVSEAMSEDQLSRFEFFEAVLLLAADKFQTRADGSRRSASEALELVCDDFIDPQARKLVAGPVRTAMREPTMQRFLVRLHERLRRVFDFYCALPDRGPFGDRAGASSAAAGAAHGTFTMRSGAAGRGGAGGGGGGGGSTGPGRAGATAAAASAAAETKLLNPQAANVVMDEREFCTCLEHAGLMAPAVPSSSSFGISAVPAHKGAVSRSVAREAFAGVQRDDDGGATLGLSKAEALESMVFNEFLEALARIGVHRWADEAVSIARKIKWVFRVVADLDDHLGAPREELVEPPKTAAEERAWDINPVDLAPAAGSDAAAAAADKAAHMSLRSAATARHLA
jgi:hypothetical protein